jgi:hypothetical protein
VSVFLQPIYTQTVGAGGAGAITFNNIPQTFTDLKLVVSARTSVTGYYNDLFPIQFNTDSSSSYSRTLIYGLGSAGFGSFNNANTSTVGAGVVPTSAGTTSTFSNLEIYLPNYTSSNYKQIIVDSAAEDNSTNNAYLYLGAGLYRGTSAITKMSISLSFSQYSTFSLYGVLRAGI